MDQPDPEAEPQFTQPFRQVILMLAVLGLSGFGGFWRCRAFCRCFNPTPT